MVDRGLVEGLRGYVRSREHQAGLMVRPRAQGVGVGGTQAGNGYPLPKIWGRSTHLKAKKRAGQLQTKIQIGVVTCRGVCFHSIL